MSEKEGAKAFSVWVRQRLIELDKDQKGLADELNLVPSQVNKMIHGNRKINLEEFPVVANYLEISTDELFEFLGIKIRKNNSKSKFKK